MNIKGSVFLIVCTVVFTFHARNVSAQDYPFRRYRVSDGLVQSQGRVIYNDSRGYIWIGTNNGLSRFDGIDFVNYNKSQGLPSNSINDIFEDDSGGLWVETNEGFSEYTGSGFIFYQPADSIKNKGSFRKSLNVGNNGNIYGLLGNRLVLFRNGSYSFVKGNPFDTIILEDALFDKLSGAFLLLDTAGALYKVKGKRLKRISDGKFRDVQMINGKVLVFTKDSVVEYKDDKIIPYRLSYNHGVKDVKELNPDFEDDAEYYDGYQSYKIRLPFRPLNIYPDRQGSLWFPTENDVYRLMSTAFASLRPDIDDPGDIWTICSDRNNHLWLGSVSGDLFEYDGKSYINRNEYKRLFSAPYGIAFYKGSRILSNGEIWFSLSEGVLIYDGYSFRRFRDIPEGTQVCFIYEDPDNHNIMIGTAKGLYITDRKKTKCYPRFNDNDLGVVEGIARDRNGFYWISGHKGVVKFDGEDAYPVNDDVLPSRWTNNIEADSMGGVWVATDDGLFCKRSSDEHFYPGLPSKINRPVGSLKILGKSELLVGRGGDICLIDLGKYYDNNRDYYRIYDATDGYTGDECLDNGIIKGSGNTYWILTSDNIVKFMPERLHKNLQPPQINFTGIFCRNESQVWQPFSTDNFYKGVPSEIKFPRYNHNIRITYSGISYPNPEKVRYIFWLEGFDKNWSQPTADREVIYDNLSPGKYCFHLKGINADGVENPDSSDLRFAIAPAFYETLIFRIISVLILIFVTVHFTRYFLKKSHLQKEEKQKVSSELLRLQINSVIREFDPHFTFNAMSSLGSLIMSGKSTEAYSYLTKLSSMLRTAMHDESEVIKSLEDELTFVRNYLELQKLRFGERFSYNVIIAEDTDLKMMIPKMTIQTFVENSVRHGLEPMKKNGIIELELSHPGNNTVIEIRDNGIGRNAASAFSTGGFGFGIKTVRRIFEIMNQENHSKASVEITDLNDGDGSAGTVVVVTIPDGYSFNSILTLADKITD